MHFNGCLRASGWSCHVVCLFQQQLERVTTNGERLESERRLWKLEHDSILAFIRDTVQCQLLGNGGTVMVHNRKKIEENKWKMK